MAYDYSQILQAQAERISTEQASASAELEAGRLADDADRVMRAAEWVLQLDAQRKALIERANQFTQPQAAPLHGEDEMSRGDAALCRKYGLASGDLKVAKGWTATSDMSDEQKVREYLENRQRLAQMRASGQYRDDQGRVTR